MAGEAPSFDANAALLQDVLRRQQGGQQGGAVLGILQDVQFTNFKLPAGIFIADGMVNKLPQRRPGMRDKACQALGLSGANILEDLKKCAQGAGAIYAGDLPGGYLPGAGGSGLPMAGSQVAALSQSNDTGGLGA